MREEYKIIFRLILTTGLRRSEAVCLRKDDIEWPTGSIKILDGKGNKDRMVYMADDMTKLLQRYVEYLNNVIPESTEWLFPSFDIHKHMSGNGLSQKFKLYWKKTPYASTCEKEPTLHALRHTFVVVRINQWIANGIDAKVMLPYLSRQLGHKSPKETFYYYHQVQDSFRIIHEKDTLSSTVLPEVRVR